jgi:hypothetical protein
VRILCANWSAPRRHISRNLKANNQDLQSEMKLVHGNVSQEHNQQREQNLQKDLDDQKTSQAVSIRFLTKFGLGHIIFDGAIRKESSYY